MSSVASQASAVHHGAHPGQGPRSNVQSPDTGDQASPFAALLDGKNDPAPPPQAAAPATPASASQKPVAHPQDGGAPRPASTETSPGPQKSSSDGPGPQPQAGGAPPAPPIGQNGADITAAALAALVKKANKDSKTQANPDATLAATQSDPTAGNIPVDPNAASSTAPADTHGDKKPDTSNSDAASAATPPAEASGSQQPLTPPPIAAVLALPVIAAATSANDGSQAGVGNGNASSDASAGTAADAAQIAALGNAIRAGAPRGKADGANAQPTPPGTGTASDGSANPGVKAFDAARLTPALTPQPPQNAPLPPTGQGQPTAGDGSQTRNADVASTTQAA
ncbi:MAG TPA: hypothetical protein VIY51_16870, partial [Xanthobacteraceae bacterium]